MKESHISLSEKITFGLGAMSKDIIYWFIGAYLMLYLTDFYGMSAAFIGFILLIGKIANAFLDPFLGYAIDNTTTRFSKFKPWIIVGSLLTAVTVTCLFYKPNLQGSDLALYGLGFYFLTIIAYSLMDIPFWSLIPNFGTVGKDRLIMTAIPRAMTVVGGQFILIFGLFLIRKLTFNSQHDLSEGFFMLAAGCALFFLITQLVMCFTLKTRRQKFKYAKFSISKAFELISKNDQLLATISIMVLQQIAIGIVNSSLIFYFLQEHVITAKHFTIIMSGGAVIQFLTYILLPKIIGLISRKAAFYISGILMLCGFISMIFLSLTTGNPIILCISFCFANCGMALMIGLTTSMLADCVDYGEFKNGIRSEALIFSLQTFSAKLGTGIALFMSGLSISAAAYIPREITFVHQEFSFRLALVIVCLLILLSLWIYSRYYKLNGILFKSMLSTLEKLRTSDGMIHDTQKLIRYAIDERNVLLKLKGETLEEVLSPLVSCLARSGIISSISEFRSELNRRLKVTPCGIAEGIAIPHARGECVKRPAIAIAVLEKPLDLGSFDGKKCDLIFLIASPDDGQTHLNLLGRLSLVLNEQGFADSLRHAGTAREVVTRIARYAQHFD